jgi:hypothetical protein
MQERTGLEIEHEHAATLMYRSMGHGLDRRLGLASSRPESGEIVLTEQPAGSLRIAVRSSGP